ncbi:MAG: DUF4440 domain-containing protein [Chitinophagales bacterium]
MRIINLGILASLILIFTNCHQPMEKATPFDIEKAKSEIETRLRDYENAMANGDKVLFANLYAEDAEIFHDGKPSTVGRENIVKNFDSWVKNDVIGSFETTGLWGNDDLLVEQGTGYFAHADGDWKGTGKYLLVWKKVDNEWQIFRDTWFSDPKEEK